MAEADDKFSQMYKVPLRRVPLDMSVLRDNVHPNEKGMRSRVVLTFTGARP